MPICEICYTYYSHKPCPNCQPKQKIANKYVAEKIYTKSFVLAPGSNELDFIWSQICKKTIQRVQSGGQVLRQGFFNFQITNLDINFEWIGSTFSQVFYSRLEKLYPGIESILILSDIVAQNFNFNSMSDLLEDLINVNKRNLKKIFLVWLEPYVNSITNYQNYKEDVKSSLKQFFIEKQITIEMDEISLPLFSTQLFKKELIQIFSKMLNIQGVSDYLENKLPLRPLFRTQRPILDPNAPNRVIILDLEKASVVEPIKKLKIDLHEQFESQKCLACGSEVKFSFRICLTCHFAFCLNCCSFLQKENENIEDFCLGSIYHGLHRPTFS